MFRRFRTDLRAAIEGNRRREGHGVGPAAIPWFQQRRLARLAHRTRADRNLSEITGSPQLWLAADWATRFNRPADPGDTGFGHSPVQAAGFRCPYTEALLAYQDATHDLAERYLETAPAGDLDRVVISPTLGNTHTVEERLSGLLRDCFAPPDRSP
jgi:hypothetical protein